MQIEYEDNLYDYKVIRNEDGGKVVMIKNVLQQEFQPEKDFIIITRGGITIKCFIQTPKQLRRDSEKDWGLDYDEALEMAYENIQNDAATAVKGIRAIKPKSKTTV